MTEDIQFILNAGAVRVTGLSIQDGQLQLTLNAAVDLQSLQEHLRGELHRLADLHHLDAALAGDIPGGEPFLPELRLAAQAALDDGRVFVPEPVGTPEHYFPEPDDDTLLAEEEEALGFAHEELPPLWNEAAEEAQALEPVAEDESLVAADAPADAGSLFTPEALPVVPPLHYFPEPGDESLSAEETVEEEDAADELAAYDELSVVDEDDVNDLLTEDGALLAEDELDFAEEEISPAGEFAAEAAEEAEPGQEPEASEEPEESAEDEAQSERAGDFSGGGTDLAADGLQKPASALVREEETGHLEESAPAEEAASAPLSPVNLEEALSTPEGRYGEPAPDIEWSALLSDRHSELASTTRPTETPADAAFQPEAADRDFEEDPESGAYDDPVSLPDEEDFSEPQSEEEEDDDSAFEPAEDEPQEPEEEPDDGSGEESDEEPEEEGETADEPAATSEDAGGAAPRPRRPFTLINPKLHNEGDDPDDTPPGTEENPAALQEPVFFPQPGSTGARDNVAAETSHPAPSRKTRIKYVCPKCHTPGQQDIDRLGSVVTCANCGRAMRLTMKK